MSTRDNALMKKISGISFFCPAYYDAGNIAQVVEKCIKLFSEICEDYEIVIVNDGSPDNTGEVIDGLSRRYDKVKAVHHERNLGYSEALRTGFRNASKFEFILFTDGDDQYDIGNFRKMLSHMDNYDAVITYRVKNANSFARQVISRAFNMALKILFREPFRDLSSSFRLVRRSALNKVTLRSESIFLAVELILKLHKNKFRIKEIPIESHKRLSGRSTSLLPKNFAGAIKDMLLVKRKDF